MQSREEDPPDRAAACRHSEPEGEEERGQDHARVRDEVMPEEEARNALFGVEAGGKHGQKRGRKAPEVGQLEEQWRAAPQRQRSDDGDDVREVQGKVEVGLELTPQRDHQVVGRDPGDQQHSEPARHHAGPAARVGSRGEGQHPADHCGRGERRQMVGGEEEALVSGSRAKSGSDSGRLCETSWRPAT